MNLFNVTPSLANYPNYANQTRKTLEAQIGLAPQLYQANATFQPLYNALALENLEGFLLGTPEQSYTTYAWQKPIYRTERGTSGGGLSFLPGMGSLPGLGGSGGFPGLPGLGGGGFPGLPGLGGGGGFDPFGGLFGGDDDDNKRKLVQRGRYVPSGTATRGAQRGFLDIYENEIIPSLLRSQTQERASDISDVALLGPEAREALRRANPEAAALLDELFAQAQTDLGAGAALNPTERRALEQAVRAGQADRGMGFGSLDLFEEALASLNYGRDLQRERRAFAGDTITDLEDFYGDPFMAILGRSSGTGAAPGIGGLGTQASRMGSLFNPESDYAANVYDTRMNQQQSVLNAEASNNAAILGSIISAIGNIGGGAAGSFV